MFKGRHFDRSVLLLCVRWYLAYGLSLRNLEEMMAERGISVDHATIHRWIMRCSPELLEQLNRRRRAVTRTWHMDETYIKVRGCWMYLYRAVDSNGDTVEVGSARSAISLRPSGSYARHSCAMAGRSGSSSTAARPTGRRSCPAILPIGWGNAQGES